MEENGFVGMQEEKARVNPGMVPGGSTTSLRAGIVPALTFIFILLLIPAVPAATYYVSPSGNNAHDGSAGAPWATPGYGSKQLAPGDTLVIGAGTYILSAYQDDMVTPPSGTSGRPTTIRGETGSRPVLAGRDNLYAAADLGGCRFVRLENLEITSDGGSWFRAGVSMTDGVAKNIVLSNLTIHHVDDMGIDIGDARNVLVRDCAITFCGGGAIGGPAGTSGGIRNLTVDRCNLSYAGWYYRGGNGDDRPYDRPDGLGLEPSAGPVTIRRTVAAHNRGDGLDSKTRGTKISRCVVANNRCDGIKLWGGGSSVKNALVYGTGDGDLASGWTGLVISGGAGATFRLANVDIDDIPGRKAYSMTVQYDDTVPISVDMRNCIVSHGYGAAYFGPPVTLSCRNTIFFRGTAEPVQVYANGRSYTAKEIGNDALGPGNRCGDPLFAAPEWGSDGDYHLLPGSPAIDNGTAKGAPPVDLDGRKRPLGPGYDIGAYEYVPV